MNLKTAIKRINLFSQGQRLIVISSVLISLFSAGILYYTSANLLVVPIVLVINYVTFRRLLVTNKFKVIFTRSLRPLLWLLVSLYYFYSVYVISSIPSFIFMLCMIIACVVYGLLCQIEIQNEPNIVLDNALTLLIILIITSLASILTTFWKWPEPLVMALLWLTTFLISLWWLLDFTNKPQILAAIWGFVVVEFSWLSSRWVVLYQIPSVPFILSQFSIMVTAIGYGWGGIYYHFKQRNLKKSIVFEYLAVTITVFIALILINRWTIPV